MSQIFTLSTMVLIVQKPFYSRLNIPSTICSPYDMLNGIEALLFAIELAALPSFNPSENTFDGITVLTYMCPKDAIASSIPYIRSKRCLDSRRTRIAGGSSSERVFRKARKRNPKDEMSIISGSGIGLAITTAIVNYCRF
ncbi:MAG TPA: hypothetical protein VN631_15540 [Negativicutes bacterium]|nr:hypothetical protein [Negativicutes bacterium]